jgi:hypothetical protein
MSPEGQVQRCSSARCLLQIAHSLLWDSEMHCGGSMSLCSLRIRTGQTTSVLMLSRSQTATTSTLTSPALSSQGFWTSQLTSVSGLRRQRCGTCLKVCGSSSGALPMRCKRPNLQASSCNFPTLNLQMSCMLEAAVLCSAACLHQLS